MVLVGTALLDPFPYQQSRVHQHPRIYRQYGTKIFAHTLPFILSSLSLFQQGGESQVKYTIHADSDPGGLFLVDEVGRVRLAGELDRETASGHTLLILAMDDGIPRRTATATLTVSPTWPA